MRLGKPEDFYNGQSIRLRAIERSIAQYNFSTQALKQTFADKLDKHLSFF